MVGVHGYQVGLGMVEGGEMLRWLASGMNGCKSMMHLKTLTTFNCD